MVTNKSIRDKSTEELIDLCINKDDRLAWNEFFRRYLPKIIGFIKFTFRDKGQYGFANDPDIVDNIHHKIVFKLRYRYALRKCTDVSGIEDWLFVVAKNQTIEWLKKLGRNKRIAKNAIDGISLSGDGKIPPPQDIPHDIFPDEEEKEDIIDRLWDKINGIKNEKNRWIFRISVIYVLPLNDQELDSLVKFSGRSVGEIKELSDKICDYVQRKEEAKAKIAIDAVQLWYEIHRDSAILSEERKNTCDYNKEKINDLEKKLQRKMKTRENKLNSIYKVCWPSQKQIAEILGFKKTQKGQISVRRGRSQTSIKKAGV